MAAKRLGRRAHVHSNQLSLFVADDFELPLLISDQSGKPSSCRNKKLVFCAHSSESVTEVSAICWYLRLVAQGFARLFVEPRGALLHPCGQKAAPSSIILPLSRIQTRARETLQSYRRKPIPLAR